MKIRGTKLEAEKIEPQMAPMIDVVFQLLIFFMLTLKIIEPEGDFNINMPIGAPVEQRNPDDPVIPDIKVRLVAALDGSLSQVMLGQRNLGSGPNAFERLNNEILRIIGQPGNPLTKDIEVEIEADYGLHYRYTVEAISACTGDIRDGKLVRYVEKIKFAPPKRPGES